MMNRIEEAEATPGFQDFKREMVDSANYYVATHGLTENQVWAVDLCIAIAFLEGRKR